MKTVIPFIAICILLIVGLICVYFISPDYQIQTLQAENYQLKSELAQLQSNNESELVAIVICGMIGLSIVLLGSFFLILCMLAKVRPADFFTPKKPILQMDIKQEIKNEQDDTTNYPIPIDHYAYEWRSQNEYN